MNQWLFENKTIWISGGASGFGAACAQKFLDLGAIVYIADINPPSEIQISDNLHFLQTDVSDFNSVQMSFRKMLSKVDRIDIAICNAGVANKERVKTAQHSLEEWDRIIAINQSGVFYSMKTALEYMEKQGFGNIVNVSSLAGLKASVKCLAYSASKFAVVGMTKSAALEYAHKNIRINCVCPGYSKTKLFQDVVDKYDGLEERLLQFIPMGRYGNKEEIADAILWLASEHSSYITGQAITLDGGLSL